MRMKVEIVIDDAIAAKLLDSFDLDVKLFVENIVKMVFPHLVEIGAVGKAGALSLDQVQSFGAQVGSAVFQSSKIPKTEKVR